MLDSAGKDIEVGMTGSFASTVTKVAGPRLTTKIVDEFGNPYYNEVDQIAASPKVAGDALTLTGTVIGFQGANNIIVRQGDTICVTAPGKLFTLA